MKMKIHFRKPTFAYAMLLLSAIIFISCATDDPYDSLPVGNEDYVKEICNIPKFYNNQAGIYKGLILRMDEKEELDTLCECKVEFGGYNSRALVVHGFPGKLLAQKVKKEDGFEEQRKMLESMDDSLTLRYKYYLMGFFVRNRLFGPFHLQESYTGVFDYYLEDSWDLSSDVVRIKSGKKYSLVRFGISASKLESKLGNEILSARKQEVEEKFWQRFGYGIWLGLRYIGVDSVNLPVNSYPYFIIRIYEDGTENLPKNK